MVDVLVRRVWRHRPVWTRCVCKKTEKGKAMSKDIVQRLRASAEAGVAMPFDLVGAADRIVALEAEVSAWKKEAKIGDRQDQEANLYRQAAEAQASRMREALKEIATVIGPFESQGDILKYANMLADIEQIAVKALEQ